MVRKTAGLALALLAVGCAPQQKFFACTGQEGTTPNQGILPFTTRSLPAELANHVRGSVQITRESLIIEGVSNWADSKYRICAETDQSVWFSPGGGAKCNENDPFNDLGVFNKVTLDLRYHVGDYLAVLKCERAKPA